MGHKLRLGLVPLLVWKLDHVGQFWTVGTQSDIHWLREGRVGMSWRKPRTPRPRHAGCRVVFSRVWEWMAQTVRDMEEFCKSVDGKA